MPSSIPDSSDIWKHLVAHASWGVAIGGIDGRFLAVNEAFARMHGVTVDELVGTNISDVFAPAFRPELEARIRQIHERGSLTFASEHLRSDGSKFPVLIDATAIRNEQGDITHRAVYVQDISGYLRREEAYRELFEEASEGIFIADLDGRYTDVNSAACRMLGYTREELLGKSIVDLIPEEHIARLAGQKERLLQGGVDVSEWVLRRADGTFVPVEISAKILADGRWQAFVRDVSERREASLALAASEARYRQIVSLAAEAIISIDEDQKMVLFNEGAERIFGYRAQEALGQPVTLLMPERFRDQHDEHVAEFGRSVDSARPMGMRRLVRALRKSGEEFAAQASISRLMDRGRPVFTAVLRDVSAEVRALEEERFLGEVSAVLAASLDVQVTLAELSRLSVRHLADLCIVDFLQGDAFHVVHASSRKPAEAEAEFAQTLAATAADGQPPFPEAEVWRTELPTMLFDADIEDIAAHMGASRHSELLRRIAPRSMLAVPMRARGRMRGVITLLAEGRTFDRRDLQLAAGIADRAATALDNAALHDALTRAHDILQERLRELEEANQKIRTLTGLLPVCAWCGQIRDDEDGGAWKRFDVYVSEHRAAEVTHGICPSCAVKIRERQ